MAQAMWRRDHHNEESLMYEKPLLEILLESNKCESEENIQDQQNLFVLEKEFVDELIADSVNPENEAGYDTFKNEIKEKSVYPLKPFYKTLARNLYKSVASKRLVEPSIASQENVPDLGLNTIEYQFMDSKKALLMLLAKSEDNSERCSYLKSLVKNLCKADVLMLMGLGRTEGSLETLPPDLYKLWHSFQSPHHPKSKLTVGARALTKHCHRSSELFWGVCAGSESDKNDHALHVMRKIFIDCCWINIHTLPHQTYVLEMRCSNGYGLRWKHDGSSFRGFLEPQMENGHEIGWRH